ncbi:putative Ig domain-containing protein [Arthrobacter sp. yr096]|uniref:putative Ig domain-containing protein n=1 Tax=Arthrobacter sp. yr096 TaxID=1761750 RepID=UPI000B8430AB|nr:putative Ig domain-containing protein [Arthrobacter sp. yr096]
MMLAVALAGALALQFAPPGSADTEPSVPPGEPAATASVVPSASPSPSADPSPSANASPDADSTPSASPSPSADPAPSADETPAAEPAPSASPAATQPPAAELPVTDPLATVEAVDPLAVRSYVDRGYLTKAYDAPLVISGGTAPYTATVSDVPPGLTFDPASLRFTGMPTQEGYFRMQVTVLDSSEPAQSAAQEVAVDFYDYAPPQFRTVTGTEKFTDGVVGAWYSESILVWTVGGQPYSTAVVSGALPPGMSWGQNAASGTPTAAGTYKFTVRFSDSYESTDAEFTLTVRASRPQTTGFAVPAAVLGEPYSAKIASVTGGVAPYRFWWATPRHMAGSLWWHDPGPDGLTIDANGVLQGTPTSAGSFQIWVYFSDSGLYNQGIFTTVVTVLPTRPPVVEQPPAVVDPLPAVDAAAPPAAVTPAAVTPAGTLASTSGVELAATGLQSGSLPTIMWSVAGLFTLGAALTAAGRRRFGGGRSSA